MGAVVGSEKYREEYVNQKLDNWIRDVAQLTLIATDEPQLALSAFTKALCMRWLFMQRTIPNIKDKFQPLEDVIREKLIPAIVGKRVSPLGRRVLALPVRLGGLGIQNPVDTADGEFKTSVRVTKNLNEIIQRQEQKQNYKITNVREEIAKAKTEKESCLKEESKNILGQASGERGRTLLLAAEKGAGAWLTALPIQSIGYDLNKQEFRDGIHLRYGWRIPNTPSHCSCGQKNTIDHTLNCKLGGYVNMRHNGIRDLEAEFLREICKDVRIEPELLPIGNVQLPGSNNAEKARLDVSAIGVWCRCPGYAP